VIEIRKRCIIRGTIEEVWQALTDVRGPRAHVSNDQEERAAWTHSTHC
jgi:hypothetical protein